MINKERLLKDLKKSEPGSIDEKVCMDVFMNLKEYENDINFIMAFHGPIIRDDVIHILDTSILKEKKEEITKSITKTIPGFLAKIKLALMRYKNIKK